MMIETVERTRPMINTAYAALLSLSGFSKFDLTPFGGGRAGIELRKSMVMMEAGDTAMKPKHQGMAVFGMYCTGLSSRGSLTLLEKSHYDAVTLANCGVPKWFDYRHSIIAKLEGTVVSRLGG